MTICKKQLSTVISTILVIASTTVSAKGNTRFTQYLSALIDKQHYVGLVVLVDKPGVPLWEKAMGYANLEKKIPTKPDDLFRIASSTKTFVATAVIKLAIQDKIKLDDSLSTYLDEATYQNISNAEVVTIRQLLGMQSGIYNYTNNPKFEDFVENNPSHKWTAEDALDFARNMPAEFELGTASKYSNTNYILLGLVIEKVTGHSLADTLKNQIFDPLKLSNTYLEMYQNIPRAITPGYMYDDGNYENMANINDGRGLADGGVVSDARDLNTFIRNLLTNDSFMPPKWRKQMLKFHPMHSGDNAKYGLGLILFSSEGMKAIGHDGNDSGYQSWMILLPESKTSIIFLTNNNPPRLNHDAFIKALKQSINKN
jgi:D-alanyl-D-alanine carboxypeptidase